MEILKNLKLNTWYGITLYLGVLLIAASLFFKIDFLKNSHLFGLGLGAVLIGLSFIISETENSFIKPTNFYTGGPALITYKTIEHNFFTKVLFLIGVLLVALFGFYIVKDLI
jgi:hypothetical protein